MDEITPLFKNLPSIATPHEIKDSEFKLIEFFVERLYSKTCNTKEVNEAREEEFSFPGIRESDQEHLTYQKGTKTILPSDQSFNLQSGQRQKSFCKDLDCWDACQKWGWQTVKNKVIPLCRELVKYGCKKGCTGQCKSKC